MCEEHGNFPNVVQDNGLWSGFLYYCLTTPACSMPGVPNPTYWGTQQGSFRCKEHGNFPNMVQDNGLWSGTLYYCLTTPACSMPRVPQSNLLGHTTKQLCGQTALFPGQSCQCCLVNFYDKLSVIFLFELDKNVSNYS